MTEKNLLTEGSAQGELVAERGPCEYGSQSKAGEVFLWPREEE